MDASGRHQHTFGTVAITLTLLAWSSVPLFLKHFSLSIDLWTSNGWRYGISALLWAPVLIVVFLRKRWPARLWRAALVPSVINAAGQVTFVAGHYLIDPGLLSFGLRSQMIFAALGAYVLFASERPIVRSGGYLLGMLALLGGTSGALLLGQEPIERAHAFGIVLSITSGLLFACYGLSVRRFMHGVNSVVAFAAISQYTALAMVVLMLLLGQARGAEALAMSADQLLLLLVSGVIGIALGHVLYYMAIARLGVAVSAGVLQLHPFFVAIGSMLLFRESLTLLQWTFGGVAVVGAGLMLHVQRRVAQARHIDTMEVALAEGEGGS